MISSPNRANRRVSLYRREREFSAQLSVVRQGGDFIFCDFFESFLNRGGGLLFAEGVI